MSSSSSSAGDDKLRLHICGMDDAGSSGGNDDGDRATFFGNPCLDLFLLKDHDAAPHQRLRDLLADAWDQDALTALKLVCYRHTVDGEGFFAAAATWMLQTHPPVFADNIPAFVELGYGHHLAALLERLDDHDGTAAVQVTLPPAPAGLKHARDDDDPDAPATTSSSSAVPPVRKGARHDQDDDPAGASASASSAAATPTAVLLADPAVPAPPSAVPPADPPGPVFGRQAALELEAVDPKPEAAAAPAPELGTTDKAPYRSMLRHLRHSVLPPLVSALHKHKQQAFESQTAEPMVQNKLPHLIAGKFAREVWENISDQKRKETTEEWRAMVDDLRAKGSLTNCIAICDVSLKKGNSLKLFKVCVTLGLLISELSDEPWKNWLHAFSEGDGSHSLADKTSYMEKVQAILVMECNEEFNLRKVLEWVLGRALSNNVEPKNMVKKIFVFTGKDFDQAIVPPSDFMRPEDRNPGDFDPEDVRRWRDDYRIVCDKFKQNGYDDNVPGVVVWNLMGDRSAALTSTPKHGVISLSGYSDELMSLFLEKGGVVHAEDEMDAAIAGEKYQKLEVKYYPGDG